MILRSLHQIGMRRKVQEKSSFAFEGLGLQQRDKDSKEISSWLQSLK